MHSVLHRAERLLHEQAVRGPGHGILVIPAAVEIILQSGAQPARRGFAILADGFIALQRPITAIQRTHRQQAADKLAPAGRVQNGMRPPDILRRSAPPAGMEIAQVREFRRGDGRDPRAHVDWDAGDPPGLQRDLCRLRKWHGQRAKKRVPPHAEIERLRAQPPPRRAAKIAQRDLDALVGEAVVADAHLPIAQHGIARVFGQFCPVRREFQPRNDCRPRDAQTAGPSGCQRGFLRFALCGQLAGSPQTLRGRQCGQIPLRQRPREGFHRSAARQARFRNLVIHLGARRAGFALDAQRLGVGQRHERIPAVAFVFRQRGKKRSKLAAE